MAFTTRRMLLGSVLAVGGILFLAVASVNRNLKCATCRLKDADVADSFSLVDVSRRADDLCHIPSTCRAPEADRQRELADVMTGYTGSRISASDAGLIDRIRKHFIDLPRPYVTKFSMPIVETPQAKEVSRILKHKVSLDCFNIHTPHRFTNVIHVLFNYYIYTVIHKCFQ